MRLRVLSAPTGRLARLNGSVVALATPFLDGAVDLEALEQLCDRQVRCGSAAIVVCGSTGEGPALSIEEHGTVIAMAVAAAGRQVPIIAGCSAPSTSHAVALARNALRHGAAGLLCTPPSHVKPTQDGIAAHVQAVAHAAGLPVMLHDIPGGIAAADETVVRLFEAGSIIAIKDASGDLARPARLRALCGDGTGGDGLIQMSGDDATACAHLAMGGSGCVSMTANIVPALCARLHAAWRSRDLAAFARIRDVLAPLHDALALESDPVPLKSALFALHLCTGDLRMPWTPASTATRERLTRVLPGVLAAEDAASGRPHLALVR